MGAANIENIHTYGLVEVGRQGRRRACEVAFFAPRQDVRHADRAYFFRLMRAGLARQLPSIAIAVERCTAHRQHGPSPTSAGSANGVLPIGDAN